MSGQGQATPVDRSAQEAAARAAAEAEAKRKEDEAKAAWNATLGGAYDSAINDAREYFELQGLDPTEYMDELGSAASRIKSKIPMDAADPSSFFTGLGEDVYNTEELRGRNTYGRAFNEFAPVGFESRRVADTADDDILASINNEEYATADSYLQNLLNRGVITGTGYQAGRRDLDNQKYRATAKLEEAGTGALSNIRTNIGNKANEGRNAAANWQLGNQFDPWSYNTDINNAVDAFFQGLSGNIRNRVGGPLYTTSNLATVAGAGQGAQNTNFDPAALAGMLGVQDDEEDDYGSIF